MMDLGEIGARLKAANALDRKIKFIEAQVMLSDAQKRSLVVPLYEEKTRVLTEGLPQGELPLAPEAGPSKAPSKK